MRNGRDEPVRCKAAQALLDRGWGKLKLEVDQRRCRWVFGSV